MEVRGQTARAQVSRAASLRQCDREKQQQPVRMRPLRASYGTLSKLKSRSSLPLLPDAHQRSVVRWPSLNSVHQKHSNSRRDSRIDECRVADPCDVLGERGAPEGKEDSASFTSSKEDLNVKCLLGPRPLASSSMIIHPWVNLAKVNLKSVVRDRLTRSFRLNLPLLPWNVGSIKDGCLEDEAHAPNVPTKDTCRVFLNWTDNCEAVDFETNEAYLKIGGCHPISWEDLEKVEVYQEAGMLFINHFPVCVPDRASFLHLCSKIAHRLRRVGRDLAVFRTVNTDSPKFLVMCRAEDVFSLGSRAKSSATLTVRCAWKSLKARAGDRWQRGYLELAVGDGDDIYLSESLHKAPSLVVCHPRRPSDVRLVAVDAKVADELADFSSDNR